jgi:hypothetical protein
MMRALALGITQTGHQCQFCGCLDIIVRIGRVVFAWCHCDAEPDPVEDPEDV